MGEAGAPRHLSVTGDVADLATVRAFVRDAAAAYGASELATADLVQAVDEAACNSLIHGYAGRPGELEIDAALRDGRIELRILDRCPVFDPTQAPQPDRAGAPIPSRPGGMGVGIQLLRTMVDEVHHAARAGGGNELTLVRSIDAPAVPAKEA